MTCCSVTLLTASSYSISTGSRGGMMEEEEEEKEKGQA